MKKCSDCRESKPLDEFYKDKSLRDGFRSRCKECSRAHGKAYYKKNKDRIHAKDKRYREENPDRVRDSRLRHWYNISLEQYNKMLKEQDYVCAICKRHNIAGKSLSVDHNHKCCPGKRSCGDCVRALLCFKCNTTLGQFEDDEGYLQETLNYIKKYRKNGD